MADPFAVRMRFTAQLKNLNASVTSSQKAAQLAIRYKDMDEDLHSCILEQLEKPHASLNTRANIMFFIEHFLDLAQKDGYVNYITMMQRDIIRVVDAVAPDDGSGAANVKVVRKVLQALQLRSLLDAQTVSDIEQVLKDRDTSAQDIDMLDVPEADDHGDNPPGGAGRDPAAAPSQSASSSKPPPPGGKAKPAPVKLDKRQIEQRIEEDRERHKRLRENIWATPAGADAEMWKLWEETSSLGEDDHRMGEEEWQEFLAAEKQHACAHLAAALGDDAAC